VEIGKIQRNRRKNEEACSTIQLQHIRTRLSHCKLLLVRIASASARAPTSPMFVLPFETMRMRGKDRENSTQQKKN
jgi:hypothetical protein